MKNEYVDLLINQIAKETGTDYDTADDIVRIIVDIVNNGGIGEGGNKVRSLMQISRKKFKAKELIVKVTERTEYEEAVVAKVVNEVLEIMRKTMSKGGLVATQKMFKLMKRPEKISDSEVNEIDDLIHSAKDSSNIVNKK